MSFTVRRGDFVYRVGSTTYALDPWLTNDQVALLHRTIEAEGRSVGFLEWARFEDDGTVTLSPLSELSVSVLTPQEYAADEVST